MTGQYTYVAADVWVVATDDWVDVSCPSMCMMLPVIVIKLLKWLDYTRQWKEKSCTTNLLPSFFLVFPVTASFFSLGCFLATVVSKMY